MGTINIKRIYAQAEAGDGKRVLLDRLWPRGVSKDAAKLDLWLKDVAPSTELRQWFHAGEAADRWKQFKLQYLAELKHNTAVEVLRDLIDKNETVTLLYSVHDEVHNHAQLLKDFMQG
jgi:uncharacterized protein YeaO (DUF488 family)